jgi:type I restriction enzyme S subunit
MTKTVSAEWRVKRLGDVAKVIPGFAFKSKDWCKEGIPVIKIKNIVGDLSVDTVEADCVPHDLLTEKIRKFVLDDGDILVAMTGATAGKVGRLRCKRPHLLNQRVAKLAPYDVDPFFFWAVVSSDEYQGRFFKLADGAAQPNMSGGQIEGVELLVPSSTTQRKIAGVLSAYDDLIENSTRRIAILEEMAQAIYREWFVNFRFPGHKTTNLINSPLGKIPEGWKIVPLADKLTLLETGSRPKGGVGEIKEGVPSIGAESIMGAGKYDFSKTKFVPIQFFERMRQGLLCDRDVLVYKDGGKPGYFIPHVSFVGSGFPFTEMAINSHVYRLRAAPPISQEFLYYHLSSDEMLHWMHLHGTGAAIPSIARKDLERLPLIVPSPEISRQFTEFAAPLLTQILILARQLKNLRHSRDLLLPKLISGQLDVEELDIDDGELLVEATT